MMQITQAQAILLVKMTVIMAAVIVGTLAYQYTQLPDSKSDREGKVQERLVQ